MNWLSNISLLAKREVHMERQEALPFNVTLLVKDGKELKAHRDVLSEASLFFEKLLESDMKEGNEGVIRLEVFTELIMKEILKFIYTSDVQISSEENARELIMAGDYLFLPKLKTIAGRFLEHSMTVSCCISTYYFAETYRCDELVARAKTFVQYNFALVAKCEEFLNLNSQQVEEWLSDDEIVIHEEEDVFNVIIGWIRNEEKTRSEKFEELFRHVRLIFVSREFLQRELLAQDLVKQNDSCMNRVKQAMNWIDRSDDCLCDPPSQKSPRKGFVSDVLVVYSEKAGVACFLPDKEKWFGLPIPKYSEHFIISHQSKLYTIRSDLHEAQSYDFACPSCSEWTSFEWSAGSELLEINKYLDFYMLGEYGVSNVLAVNGEIYAVVTDMFFSVKPKFLKYNMESHSWQILSFSFLDGKYGACVVAFEKYIYVVGGYSSHGPRTKFELNDAARFDTTSNTWQEIAGMQEGRSYAFGEGANEKLYIAGGQQPARRHLCLKSCEVYNMSTNEWYFIASLRVPSTCWNTCMVCVGGALYIIGKFTSKQYSVQVYDSEHNKWRKKTTLPFQANTGKLKACSIRLSKSVRFGRRAIKS